MSKVSTAINLLRHNKSGFLARILMKMSFLLPDKPYLSMLYRLEMGKWIDWKNPKTFTEKLQWLKLYDFKPEYTKMVDKYAVKGYVASIIGEQYIIPTLGVWDKVEDIDWDSLPDQFVLKTTHGGGGGGVVICSDKSKFDRKSAEKKLSASMRANAGKTLREKPYLKVRRRIIAEKYMADFTPPVNSGLKDYKFFCFGGKVKCFKVDYDRLVDHHANYYTPQGEMLPFGETALKTDYNHQEVMPENLDEMISIAERLSKDLKFVRVDLYNISGKIYFGEITFYPAGGVGSFTPDEWDAKLGSWLQC